MKEDLEKIEKIIGNSEKIKNSNILQLLKSFLNEHIKLSHIEKYIGDYPTFIEPVYLGENVKIGDDVLLGPNVYIGANSNIGDYVEISNCIIFDNVTIGDNFNLENCIIARNSQLTFKNLHARNSIISGITDSEDKLEKISF